MKLSQQSLSAIEKAIQQSINTPLPEQSIVTDIHLQPNQNSGDLIIFDDEDKELACISIEEWRTMTVMISMKKCNTYTNVAELS